MPTQSRQLAAIMFTDIVGYTALMGEDEQRAFELLKKNRQVQRPIIEKHGGKLLKEIGDGILASFGSASDAVYCALEIQNGSQKHANLSLRIGIHLGDVVFEKGDVFGDGVNVASRIESMGIPGCILVSKAIRDQLVNKGDFLLRSLDFFEFKNVEEPMEVFAIANEGIAVPKREQMSGKIKAPVKKPRSKWMVPVFLLSAWFLVEIFNFVIARYSLDPVLLDLFILVIIFGLLATLIYTFFKGRFNKTAVVLQIINVIGVIAILFYFLSNPLALNPGKLRLIKLYEKKSSALKSLNSLAVLPFSNNLGDDSQEYLLAGMHIGLINEISQLGSIRIISRTTTLPYQNTNKSIQQIAKELEVDAIIEASFVRVDTVIELRINLVSAFPDELVVWNHSFSTSLGELPNLYKEVTKNVALEINKVLLPEEEQKLQPQRTPNPGAYEAYLRGSYYTGFLTPEGFELAKTQFENAIEIDPLFAPGYGGLAQILGSQKQMGYVSGAEVDPILDSLAKKTYDLDSLNYFTLMGLAAHRTWTKYEWVEAEKFFKKSIDINPNNALSRAWYAHYLMIQNRWKEAWEQMDYAIELDPQDPWVIAFSVMMYGLDGKLLSAYKHSERLIKIAPNHPMANRMLLLKHIILKNHDLAIAELKIFVARTGAPDLDARIDDGYKNKDFNIAVESVATYLEEYSKENFVAPGIIHGLYKILDDTDKQLEWMLKMYEVSDPNLPYFAIRNDEPIQQHPTYIMIMEEIGLW